MAFSVEPSDLYTYTWNKTRSTRDADSVPYQLGSFHTALWSTVETRERDWRQKNRVSSSTSLLKSPDFNNPLTEFFSQQSLYPEQNDVKAAYNKHLN